MNLTAGSYPALSISAFHSRRRRCYGCYQQVPPSSSLAGDVLDILEHPNRERYPSQRVLIVIVDDSAFIVPFLESEEIVFLKTIIPSRKATRKCLGDS